LHPVTASSSGKLANASKIQDFFAIAALAPRAAPQFTDA
jgi:hypothetical protein